MSEGMRQECNKAGLGSLHGVMVISSSHAKLLHECVFNQLKCHCHDGIAQHGISYRSSCKLQWFGRHAAVVTCMFAKHSVRVSALCWQRPL
jgi:hypothetical protein